MSWLEELLIGEAIPREKWDARKVASLIREKIKERRPDETVQEIRNQALADYDNALGIGKEATNE